jgi:NitT/TauT family transport system substrate-binding protein
MGIARGMVKRLDAEQPLLVVAGIYAGCLELFGTDAVDAIRDLNGKTVAVSSLPASKFVRQENSCIPDSVVLTRFLH